jgi:hypothetical protein
MSSENRNYQLFHAMLSQFDLDKLDWDQVGATLSHRIQGASAEARWIRLLTKLENENLINFPDDDNAKEICPKKPKEKQVWEDAAPPKEVKKEPEVRAGHPKRTHHMILKSGHSTGLALTKKEKASVKTAEEEGISLENQLDREKKEARLKAEKKSDAKLSKIRKSKVLTAKLPTLDASSDDADEDSATDKCKVSAKTAAMKGRGKVIKKSKKVVEEVHEDSVRRQRALMKALVTTRMSLSSLYRSNGLSNKWVRRMEMSWISDLLNGIALGDLGIGRSPLFAPISGHHRSWHYLSNFVPMCLLPHSISILILLCIATLRG